MGATFNHRKITQALNFFAVKEGGPIVKMKALKLLWLADRLHLRKYGRTITDDTYYAMRNGPVASNAYNIASHKQLEKRQYLPSGVVEYSKRFVTENSQRTFASIAAVDERVFSQTDRDALQDVYEEFGQLSEVALSELSHQYPEWAAFERELAANPSTRHRMHFEDFFLNAETSNRLFAQDAEVLELSQEVFYQPW